MSRLLSITLVSISLVSIASSLHAADTDIVITEILYNPNPLNTGGEFVEIQNTGAGSVNVSGWVLTQAIDYTFPQNTMLDAGEIVVIARNAQAAASFYGISVLGQYSGALSNSGDSIVLRDNGLPRVTVDVVVYSDGSHPLESDPWPVETDGAGPSLELMNPAASDSNVDNWGLGRFYSPGVTNDPSTPGSGDIVITEIMYQPRKKRFMENLDVRKGGYWWENGRDPDGEYVELYNRGTQTVTMTGWSFVDGIDYDFNNGFSLSPGEYVAVCANASAIVDHYFSGNDPGNVVGNFTGVLDDGGEHITLVDETGAIVDTVDYNDSKPWPISPDQDGQSLELLDPDSPNHRPDNWRTARVPEPPNPDLTPDPVDAEWMLISVTGLGTSGQTDGTHPIYFYSNGPSEWLIDDVSVVSTAGGPNLITNGTFESGDAGWNATGSHSQSDWTDTDAFSGSRCGRVLAASAGGSNTNSYHWPDIVGMVTGQEYRLTFQAKYRGGIGQLINRLSGSGLRVTTSPPTGGGGFGLRPTQSPLTFSVGTETWMTRGTPGEPNTVSSTGIPPLAHEFVHEPLRPGSTDSVLVTTRVSSNAPVTEVLLEYDAFDAPYNNVDDTASIPMRDDGIEDNGIPNDGVYGARIPAQPSQALVRYRVAVTNMDGLSWTWPDEEEPSPNGAYFVYDGEEETNLPAYFMIVEPGELSTLQANLTEFTQNIFTTKIKEYVSGALVIDGITYDHVRLRYRSDRTHPKKSYKFQFNKQEYYRDISSLDTNYDWPTTEKAASNLYMLLGQSENIAMELIRLYTNGQFKGVHVAQESPNRSWLRRVGLHEDSEIYKSKSSDGCCSGFDPTFPNCPNGSGDFCASNLHWKNFYTTDHLPRMYIKRGDSLGSFSSLEDLIFNLRDQSSSGIINYINNETKSFNWIYKSAVHALQPHCDYHAKNFYIMRSPDPEGRWDVIYFDYDRFWGCRMFGSCHSTTENPKCSGTNFNSRVYSSLVLNGRFLDVLEDTASILTPEIVGDMLDRLYAMTSADRSQERTQVAGSTVVPNASLASIKSFFAARHNHIVNSYLPGQGRTPVSNRRPGITLDAPLHTGKSRVSISWSHSDPEGNNATVDLFWTDLGFSHLVPIPGATDLPASDGSYQWLDTLPVLTGKPIYIHAVIDDGLADLVGHSTSLPIEPQEFLDPPFRRGDVDGNGILDLADDVNNLTYQFVGSFQPTCLDALDVNDSGEINIADPLRSLFFQFSGGPPPADPGHESCGVDPSSETVEISCDSYAGCPAP